MSLILEVTVFPIKKLWTTENISGMFIVSRPIRWNMKPQQITAKPQHEVVTTWQETTSWLFLPRQIFILSNAECALFLFQLMYQQIVAGYELHFMEKRCWVKQTRTVRLRAKQLSQSLAIPNGVLFHVQFKRSYQWAAIGDFRSVIFVAEKPSPDEWSKLVPL